MAGYWLEIWRRPGAADFGKVIDSPPFRDASFHIGVGLIGDGTMTLPDTFPYFDDILDVVGEVGSTVRLREDATGSIVGEWLPSAIFPVADKASPFLRVAGNGMNEIMDYAKTEAWDWDGSIEWASQVPDHIYGGDNILSNPGFEENTTNAASWTITIVASAGTYTISDGTDTTSAIAFNASAATIEAEIEADLGSVTDIAIASAGPGVFVFTMVTPPFGVAFTLNDAGLTGTGEIELTSQGGFSVAGWTPAMSLAQGAPIGHYEFFGIDDTHVDTGSWALLINPGPLAATANRLGGAQQVVTVKPGQVYQASIRIWTSSATDDYRLAIVGVGEEFIANTAFAGTTLTPNQFNTLSLTNVTIPAGVTEVIFRVQNTNTFPSNPVGFWIDTAQFNEGMPPTTVGEIIRDLFEDATVDHVADGRLVWEDEANPGTSYLSLDFSDTLDSSGAAWANDEVSIRIFMRFSYLQVLEALESQEGIEWRVVPDDPEAGTWLLQVYDQENMDAAPDLAIQGGSQDTRRTLRRFRPDTAFLVEGEARVTARAVATSGFGRMEAARLDRSIPASTALALRAVTQDRENAGMADDVWSYQLTDPQDAPLFDYTYGDTIAVHDPPDVDDSGRVWEVNMSMTADRVEWDIDILKPEVES